MKAVVLALGAALCMVGIPMAAAAGGWVLMEPPETEVPDDCSASAAWRKAYEVQAEVDRKRPLSEWRQVRAFDSAMECEFEIRNGRDIRGDMASASLRWTPEDAGVKRMRIIYMVSVMRWSHARCIPASKVPVR